MPCTSFSKALIVLGVSWSMSKLESLSSLLELLVSLSESLSLSLSLVSTSASTAACSFLVKVVLVVLSLSEVVWAHNLLEGLGSQGGITMVYEIQVFTVRTMNKLTYTAVRTHA